MKYYTLLLFSAGLFFTCSQSKAQFSKIDSTLKIGKIGYRVNCPNKSPERNHLEVKPLGFENTARVLDFYIKGYVTKLEIDDLNADGNPDLLVYINPMDSIQSRTIYVFASQENKSIVPVALPDIMLDGKIKEGYKGHNEIMLLEGKVIVKFPLFKPGDEKDKPTGGYRTVFYKMVNAGDMMGYKFIVQHTYDTK